MHCPEQKLEAGTPVKQKADLNHRCGTRIGEERPRKETGRVWQFHLTWDEGGRRQQA